MLALLFDALMSGLGWLRKHLSLVLAPGPLCKVLSSCLPSLVRKLLIARRFPGNLEPTCDFRAVIPSMLIGPTFLVDGDALLLSSDRGHDFPVFVFIHLRGCFRIKIVVDASATPLPVCEPQCAAILGVVHFTLNRVLFLLKELLDLVFSVEPFLFQPLSFLCVRVPLSWRGWFRGRSARLVRRFFHNLNRL